MKEELRLELFTVADVRDWIVHNRSVRGLSEQLIAKTRAWAIVNNPYAEDELNIVSAIFVNDEVAAYTYLFPDEVNRKRVYWNTVLYCSPKFEGRGFAAIVIGQFVELYGENYYDLDAAPASIENLKYNGLKVTFLEQYVLEKKHIRTDSLRGKLAQWKENYRYVTQGMEQRLRGEIANAIYRNEYVEFIDDDTYSFIKKHAKNDVFLRSQESLNWILRYPFMQDSPVANRVERTTAFASTKSKFRYHAVRVVVDKDLVGFYILNESAEMLYINYIYVDTAYEKEVFYSLAEHVLQLEAKKVFTAHAGFAEFLNAYKLYPRYLIYKKSFAYPEGFVYDKAKSIQAGDGDNIT